MVAPLNPVVVECTDVLIIGSGPAGACAAIELARLAPHLRIVVVERSSWPRDKVCGCCLGAAGVAILRELDAGLLSRMPSVPTNAVVIRNRSRAARLASSGGLVIDRKDMDPALIALATSRGVQFRPRTAAMVLDRSRDGCRVRLTTESITTVLSARAVLVADGLQGSSLDALPEFAPTIAPDSRMGVSCTLAASAGIESIVPTGEIHMHVYEQGYVGAARLHDGSLHIAAALDPAWTRERGGPARAMSVVLASCGVNIPQLADTRCLGVGLLTRSRRRVAAERLFVIGDASGYVEPFTGEGMTWALASGLAAAQVVAEAFEHATHAGSLAWSDAASRWSAWHHGHIRKRQHLCSAVRWSLRRRGVLKAAMSAMRINPVATLIAGPIVRSLSRPYSAPRALSGGVA